MQLSIPERIGMLLCVWSEFIWLFIVSHLTPSYRIDLFEKYDKKLDVLEAIMDRYFNNDKL